MHFFNEISHRKFINYAHVLYLTSSKMNSVVRQLNFNKFRNRYSEITSRLYPTFSPCIVSALKLDKKKGLPRGEREKNPINQNNKYSRASAFLTDT